MSDSAAVGHQMRPRRPDDMDFAGFHVHFLLGIPGGTTSSRLPGHKKCRRCCCGCATAPAGWRKLQLQDAKARPRGVLGTPLDFVEMTGVFHGVLLVHAASLDHLPQRVMASHDSLPPPTKLQFAELKTAPLYREMASRRAPPAWLRQNPRLPDACRHIRKYSQRNDASGN